MSKPVYSWSDAYLALADLFGAARGWLYDNAAGQTTRRCPSTTNADAILIAAIFDDRLRRAPSAFGRESMLGKWQACIANVERSAAPPADPHARYHHSKTFWECIREACLYLAKTDEPPPSGSTWDAIRAQIADPIARNALVPLPLIGGSGDTDHDQTAEETLIAQRSAYLDKRGVDDRYPKPPFPMPAIPRTTNADAMTLATYWSNRVADVNQRHTGQLDAAARAWTACVDKISAATKAGKPEAVYTANDALWSCVRDLALDVDGAIAASAADTLIGAIHKVPGMVVHGAEVAVHETGKLLGAAASGLGDLAGDLAGGFFGKFTTPLLIGGGVLTVYLLTRNRGDHASAEHA